MVTRRITEALLSTAARRWPARMREDLLREWTAEVHVLAGTGRSWAMLRYAASLAVARPVTERTTVPWGRQTWYAARLLVLAPVICVALFVGSLVAMNLALLPADSFGPELLSQIAYHSQVPLATAFCLLSARLTGRLGRRWTMAGHPSAIRAAISVTLPGFVFTSILIGAGSGAEKSSVHLPVYGCYFTLLTIVLVVAGRRSRSGRPKAAWWTAVAGAIVAADVAVMLPLLGSQTAREDGLSPATAPVWLFTSLTDFGFGVIDQTSMSIFIIGDILELDAQLLLVFTGLAFGVVFAAARATLVGTEPPEAIAVTPGDR